MHKRTLLTLFALSIVLIAANSYFSSSSAVAQYFSPLPTPSNPSDPIQPTPTPILTEEAEVALRYFSETYSVPPEQVRLGQAAVISLPVTDRTIWQANVEDYAGKQSVIVTIDLDSGSIVDGEAVRQAEQEAHVKKYGKLEPELHEHLQVVQESELTTVTIWFNVDIEKVRSEVIARYPDAKLYGFRPSDETDIDLYEKIYQEMVAADQQAYKEYAAVIVSELEKAGAEILYVDQFAPVLEAKLTKQMILDIAANDAVTNIYLSGVLQPLLDTTGPTGRFPAVWRRGITGSNIKVAVVEAEGIYFDHDYLPNGTYANPGNPNISTGHATMVAGIIASTHDTHKGVAYGIPPLYSANAGSFNFNDIRTVTNQALTANARVFNLSFGGDTGGQIDETARYFDHISYYYNRTVVAGSGNEKNQRVGSPASGYNVIAVGGLSNRNTPNWSDDVMWDELLPPSRGSTYQNPTDSREKPEVIADADEVMSTDKNNNFSVPCDSGTPICWVGTSGATAQVSGLAALLMSRESNLQYFPQVIKAIIMASSVHNVDSGNTEGGSPLVSDKDGAGAIDAALADTIVSNGWRISSVIAANSSETTHFINVAAGERVRLVLAWLSHTGPGSSYNTDVLKTNLDLRIEDQNGNYITQSTSTVDNFEIVEFTPSTSGAYRVKVKRTSSNGIAVLEDYGIAWARMGTYLPDVRFDHNGWDSTITIRNDDAQPRNVTITLLNADGSYRFGWSYLSLQPNATLSYNPDTFGHNVDNWSGAAVVDGSEDLSVVVYTDGAARGSLDNGFLPQGAGDASFEQAGTVLYAPAFYKNSWGINSSVSIVNVGSVPTNVNVEFIGRTTTDGNFAHNISSIPAGGRVTVNGGHIQNGGASWVGSLRLTSTGVGSSPAQPIVAMVNDDTSANPVYSRSYNATVVASGLVYVPAAYRNQWGFNTGLVVQNQSGTTTNVTLTFCPRLVGNPAQCPTTTINNLGPLKAQGVLLSNLPPSLFQDQAGWTGSVKLQTDNGMPIAVAVTNSNSVGGYNYSATGRGGRTVFLPYAARNANGISTGYTVRNITGGNITVQALYYNQNGTRLTSADETFTLASAQVQGYAQILNTNLPNGWQGSIVLQSTGNIVAMMRADDGDAVSAYNGIVR